jgi:integrase
MEEYGLTQYFNNKKLADDVIGLVNGLQRIMYLASLTIQAFTGMRVSEVASLKIDCLKKHRTRGKTHYIIHGVTTKFNKGEPKQVKWVTNESGRYAVDIAAQITRLTHTILMEKSGEAIDESEVPLFASLKYLGIREVAVQRRFETRMVPMNLHPTRDRSVRQAIRIAIEEEDLCELEEIDAHRAWRSESKFAVGQLWILTGHQLRRSLALYAQRSGIVSLPSLRRQLQHITDEMTRYYAKGSAFAKNFIGDHKNHFATEWLATQPISAGISYVKHVLLSDDVKFGGHGNWIEKRIRGEERSIEADRQRTLDQFERGQISYRETPLGGCTNVDPCDKRPVRWWNIDCVKGCKFLVGRLSNLERIIVFQRKLVVSLDPTSAVFQAENADLDTLTATRDRVLRQAAKGN